MLQRAITALFVALTLGAGEAAAAGDFGDFSAATQSILDNLRSATSYAHTGNISLAQVEIGDAKTGWSHLRERFADGVPAPYQANGLRRLLSSGSAHLDAADRALNAGDDARAEAELVDMRRAFYELRHASGLYDLSDCVFELSPAMEALRIAATRFSDAARGNASPDETIAAGSIFADRLKRCDAWAPADVSREPEFRRLIDGAVASSRQIGRAARDGDGPLVHRYLLELKSFERLLAFRFG
jgi:hypothetical protein